MLRATCCVLLQHPSSSPLHGPAPWVPSLSAMVPSPVAGWRQGSPQPRAVNPGIHSEALREGNFLKTRRELKFRGAKPGQHCPRAAQCGTAGCRGNGGRTGTRGAQHSEKTGRPLSGSHPESRPERDQALVEPSGGDAAASRRKPGPDLPFFSPSLCLALWVPKMICSAQPKPTALASGCPCQTPLQAYPSYFHSGQQVAIKTWPESKDKAKRQKGGWLPGFPQRL